jgi:hypothetical protein
VGRGGQAKLDITCVVRDEGREGGNRRSSQDYPYYMEKPDHSHMVSDRASNYFVTGEDEIKPGSIHRDTLPLLTWCKIIYNNDQNNIIFLCQIGYGTFYRTLGKSSPLMAASVQRRGTRGG